MKNQTLASHFKISLFCVVLTACSRETKIHQPTDHTLRTQNYSEPQTPQYETITSSDSRIDFPARPAHGPTTIEITHASRGSTDPRLGSSEGRIRIIQGQNAKIYNPSDIFMITITAREGDEQAAQQTIENFLSRFYIERTQRYMQSPPDLQQEVGIPLSALTESIETIRVNTQSLPNDTSTTEVVKRLTTIELQGNGWLIFRRKMAIPFGF